MPESSRRRRLSPRGLIVILLLLAVVAAAVLFGLGKSKISTEAAMTKLPFPATAEYGFVGSGAMAIENDVLSYYDAKNEKQWELPLTDAGCSIATGPSCAAVYTASAVQAIDLDGNVLFPSLEFSGEVISVKCGKSTIAVLKTEGGTASFIYLYDFSGMRLARLELKNTLLSYGLDDEKGALWTLMVNTDASMPVCTISTYNVSTQSDTGAMTKEGQLIERVYFSGKKTYAVGTNHLITYTETGKEESSKLIYGWKVLDFKEAKPMMFLLSLRSESSASRAAKLYSVESGTESGFRLPAGTLGAFFSGDSAVVVLPEKLVYYGSDGKVARETAATAPIEQAMKVDSHILLRAGDELYVLSD